MALSIVILIQFSNKTTQITTLYTLMTHQSTKLAKKSQTT